LEHVYVDVRACLESFSKDLIRISLPPPTVNTIFLDLIRFTPGCPERSISQNISGKTAPFVRSSRAQEDHSTSLARALISPQVPSITAQQIPHTSPRGLKRRLSTDDDDQSSPPSNRHRQAEPWSNGNKSHNTIKNKLLEGTLGKSSSEAWKGSDEGSLFYNQSSQVSGGRSSASRNQSPTTIRKIKLVVRPVSDRENSSAS